MRAFGRTMAAAVAMAMLAGTAEAGLIQGDVGIGGSAAVNTGLKTVKPTGNQGAVLFPGGTGDLAGLVTNTPMSFANFAYGAFFAPVTVWSGGGFSFLLQSLTDDVNPLPNFVAVEGQGVLKHAGFDDTPASFTFSANIAGGNGQWRFSADTATPAVPEPVTLGLLGLGLAGLAAAGRRGERA